MHGEETLNGNTCPHVTTPPCTGCDVISAAGALVVSAGGAGVFLGGRMLLERLRVDSVVCQALKHAIDIASSL